MWLFTLIWLLLCVYSFSRQDLNLTWYHWLPDWLQQLGWYQRPLATGIFVILFLLLSFSYLKLINFKLDRRWLLLVTALGVLAYPMFSYDIFNYLFNAKMVLIYGANPHLKTALDFGFDPMVRFMQNTHTPAPYGYGWTALSLLPGLAWFTGKFTIAFLMMKLFMVSFWLGMVLILKKLVTRLYPKQGWRLTLFVLNPLVLTETFINGHNDVVMMFLALLSYYLFLNKKKVMSILTLLASAAIKYATIVLLPLYLFKPKWKFFDLPTVAAILLVLVPFTRPNQVHAWYLIWAFSFAALAKSKRVVKIFTALTLLALLRYAPFIYFGHWDLPIYHLLQ